MTAKVLVTLGVLVYGVLVPFLEINSSHVFNPYWAPHARLHEVWQLATNSSLAVLCLGLVWGKGNVRLPAVLALFITGGFLFAYAIRGVYGGSMVLSDGSEKAWMGVNLGVVVFGLVVVMSAFALVLDSRKSSTPGL